MPGGFGAGLSGLAFVPGGYTQGGMNTLALQNAETDRAAQIALGKTLQSFTGGGAGMGSPGQLPGSQPITGGSLPPPPGASAAPSWGGPAPLPSPGNPGLPPPGRPNMMAGGPAAPPPAGPGMPLGPPAPFLPGGSGGPASGAQPGGPPMGGGQPQSGPMTWQQLAGKVAEMNPGAPPDVIAAAVTKAMPLMQVDSQQQWRMIQAQLAQERVNQGQERITNQQSQFDTRQAGQAEGRAEKVREFDEREGRLRESLDFRKDTKARELEMKESQARAKATSLQASQDQKSRAEAVREWQASYNAYDKYMRSRINAQTQLSGKEKQEALKELDAQWGRARQQMDQLRESGPQTTPPGGTPGLPQGQFNSRFQGATQNQAGKPVPPDKVNDIKAWLAAHPGDRSYELQRLQADGFSIEGL